MPEPGNMSGDGDACCENRETPKPFFMKSLSETPLMRALPNDANPAHAMIIDNTSFPLQILLVQSNRQDQVRFIRAIENSHVASEITPVSTAEEAIRKLTGPAQFFDLIVTEHQLPRMSGMELCRELVEKKFPLPVVLLTGPGDEEYAIQMQKLGFVNDYLVKDTGKTYLEVLPLVISEVARKYGDLIAQERHKEALKSLEKRFRTLITKNADGIVIVGKNGKIKFVNPAATTLLAKKTEDILGKSFSFSVKPGRTTELEIIRPTGKKAIAEMRVVGIEWKGKPACLASLRDITYRKKMEDALAKSNLELCNTVEGLKKANVRLLDQQKSVIEEERLKLLLQMAGATAHELNQPLTALLDHIELMKMSRGNPERLAQHMSGIEKAGKRISGIVEKIQTIRTDDGGPYSENIASSINLGQKTRILSVEALDDDFKKIRSILNTYEQIQLFRSHHVQEAIQVIETIQFDLVLSEYFFPDGTALDFLNHAYRNGLDIPFVVITDQGDEMIASQVIQAGAFGYIPKMRLSEKSLLQAMINAMEKGRLRRELREAHEKMAEMSTKDELTGLHNRRYFLGVIEREVSRARRYGTDIVLCILDVDHFKRVNDNYGHLAGDMVLSEMGRKLRKWTRDSDTVCRFGGEEFVVVLPHTNAENAKILGERLRKKIAAHVFKFGKFRFRISISIGMADFAKLKPDSPEQLTDMADQALYQAKQGGRNQLVEFAYPERKRLPG